MISLPETQPAKVISVLALVIGVGAAIPVFAQTASIPREGEHGRSTLPPPYYVTPETPQGTGPFPAIMESDPGLLTHTIYRPQDLGALGSARLPIVAFANGACNNLGNSFRYFLTEIASHGFMAIAIGPIGPNVHEFGSSGFGQPAPGSPAAALAAAGKLVSATPASGPGPAYTTATQLIDAMDWAQKENTRRDGAYFGKLDTGQIAVMGMSCGGLQAIDAAHDPRVKTLGVWNSGAYPSDHRAMEIAAARATKASVMTLQLPTIYVTGDPSDVAFANAEDDFTRIAGVPLFRAWREKTGHSGTYRESNGGEFATVAVTWLLWQLKGDRTAARMFTGPDCGLCRQPEWHVRRKNID
ncbi:MAG: alpha/beta hydrolase [Rhodocyclaceae bacterium]|nr:MAG: alpha/beta hydrolase [Rhodocyclaceae bacterium]